MGIFEIMGAAVLFGFCSVFGWNTGQIVWDAKIDPDKKIERSIMADKQETPSASAGTNK
jgi:hypothetical protein